jgi:DNA-binding IclR family transcriptional regulator
MKTGQSNGRTIRAAETVFTVIEHIDRADGLRLTELADRMPQSKSTVHHYLTTLHQLGYVTRTGNEYYLSLRFLDHGESVKMRQELTGKINPTLKNLADETSEMTWVVVAERGRSFILERESGEKAVGIDEQIRLRQHLHCHAAGKCILAHLPERQVEEIVTEHGLPAYTDQTITDPEELRAELETVRTENVAYMKSEGIEGLNSVGAPILSDGEVLGAVSVAGPAKRVGGKNLETTLTEQVQAAANAIELDVKFS